MADVEEAELSEKQKKEIAKWFFLNAPAGEIQYVAKGNASLSLSLSLCNFYFILKNWIRISLLLLNSTLALLQFQIRICSFSLPLLFCFFGWSINLFTFWMLFFFLADVKAILNDEQLYNEAASESFPLYNKSHMICLEMPGRMGDVSLWILMKTLFFLHSSGFFLITYAQWV